MKQTSSNARNDPWGSNRSQRAAVRQTVKYFESSEEEEEEDEEDDNEEMKVEKPEDEEVE